MRYYEFSDGTVLSRTDLEKLVEDGDTIEIPDDIPHDSHHLVKTWEIANNGLQVDV